MMHVPRSTALAWASVMVIIFPDTGPVLSLPGNYGTYTTIPNP